MPYLLRRYATQYNTPGYTHREMEIPQSLTSVTMFLYRHKIHGNDGFRLNRASSTFDGLALPKPLWNVPQRCVEATGGTHVADHYLAAPVLRARYFGPSVLSRVT